MINNNDSDQELMQQILSLYADREEKINKNYHIHSKFNCDCSRCQHQPMTDNQIKKDLVYDEFYNQPSDRYLPDDQTHVKFMKKDGGSQLIPQIKDPIDFLGLSIKMMQPTKNGKTLNLRVMDTLFFYQREPCVLIYHDKDKGLRIIRDRHLLTNLQELGQFLVKRRTEYDIELRIATEKRENKDFNNLEFDQKSAEIQQGIKKYVQNIGIQKDFILVKFKNGGEQIMSQLAAMQLFEKRKIDSIWDTIVMIQAYPYDFYGKLIFKAKEPSEKFENNRLSKQSIGKDTKKVKEEEKPTEVKQSKTKITDDSMKLTEEQKQILNEINKTRYQRITYIKDDIKYQEQFDKALEQICQINNPNFQTGNHIRQHEIYLKELKKKNIQQYLYYHMYQIVHFFEAYHQRKIMKLRMDFAKDDFDNLYIIDAGQLQFIDVRKIEWDEMILKEISLINPDYKQLVLREIEEKEKLQREGEVVVNHQRQKYLKQAFDDVVGYFREQYSKAIDKCESDLLNQPDIDKTDEIFKKINPKADLKFSEMLAIHKPDEIIKQKDLLSNFPIDQARFLSHQKYYRQSKQLVESKEKYKKQLRLSASKLSAVDLRSSKYAFTTK
ncbi:unnamed protein product [Paramecium primaurelia]|uniref:Uncharacterized protein n=1 Tax=Paramecium primaurelia TaxID=5886 RepID=A0A8S1M017_PARPR|nr:unnamed protein product [Paramecium primaurelia]